MEVLILGVCLEIFFFGIYTGAHYTRVNTVTNKVNNPKLVMITSYSAILSRIIVLLKRTQK